MTAVKDQPASLEDIGAGLLNGAMVTLLGCAIAVLMAWQITAELSGWLPNLKALSADLPPMDFKTMPPGERRAVIQDSVIGMGLLLAAFGIVHGGARHVRKNLALLRARRTSGT